MLGTEGNPSTPDENAPQPLADVRVVDFTHMAAGPFCTTLLGDLGADVIKVESPGRGDGLRYTDSCFDGADGSYFLGINRNKRSIVLDLKDSHAHSVCNRILKSADVVVENFRPGTMDGLGLGYKDVSVSNDKVIYVSICAFGSDGPHRDRAGMDIIVQAMSGVMGLTGHPGGEPVRVAASVADYTGALFATQAVLAGLLERQRTGRGHHIEVSLLDGQLAILSNYIPAFVKTGEPSEPVGNGHPQLTPYEVYATADSHIVVACLTQKFWRRLCDAVGLSRLIDDERFIRNSSRLQNRVELREILTTVFRRQETSEWSKLLDAYGVPNAPVYNLGEALSSEDVVARESLATVDHPVAGRHTVAANPIRWDGARLPIRRAAPRLGEHTDEVLRDVGEYAETDGGSNSNS